MIQGTILSAPDVLRDRLREMTRMQLIRTLASSRPDMSAYRDVEGACRIALRSLARRYVELHDEIGEAGTLQETPAHSRGMRQVAQVNQAIKSRTSRSFSPAMVVFVDHARLR